MCVLPWNVGLGSVLDIPLSETVLLGCLLSHQTKAIDRCFDIPELYTINRIDKYK